MKKMTLTRGQNKAMYEMAERIQKNAEAFDLNDDKVDGSVNSTMMNYYSLCSQLALAQYLGLTFQQKIYETVEELFQWKAHIQKNPTIVTKVIRQPNHRLLVQKEENPDSIFVLCHFKNAPYSFKNYEPEIFIKGWCYGKEAQKEKYLNNFGNECFFAPQGILSGEKQLKEVVFDSGIEDLTETL